MDNASFPDVAAVDFAEAARDNADPPGPGGGDTPVDAAALGEEVCVGEHPYDLLLGDIRRRVDRGEKPTLTVRRLLDAFGVMRRGYYIVQWIRETLSKYRLMTVPDFASAYIDGEIELRDAPANAGEAESSVDGSVGSEGSGDVPIPEAVVVDKRGGVVGGGAVDSSYRIGQLAPANTKPQSLAPNDPLIRALTVMMARDFSQMPVVIGEREVKGVVSWRSIIKTLMLRSSATGAPEAALAVPQESWAMEAREVMEPPAEVSGDQSLFEAIPLIVSHGYVLVRNPQDKSVQGIVTTGDLALQFQELSEPYLLLGEIENSVRQILNGKFSPDEPADCRAQVEAGNAIGSIADLAFGGYVRIFEREDYWQKCTIGLHRSTFVDLMHRVRRIRNDVMHFDPDPLADDDLTFLRAMTRFLRELKSRRLY